MIKVIVLAHVQLLGEVQIPTRQKFGKDTASGEMKKEVEKEHNKVTRPRHRLRKERMAVDAVNPRAEARARPAKAKRRETDKFEQRLMEKLSEYPQ